MEKVIAIFEHNHGFIGLAKDAHSASRWLINQGWITPSDDICIIMERTCVEIQDVMNKHGYIQLEDFIEDFIEGKYCNDYTLPFDFSTKTVH